MEALVGKSMLVKKPEKERNKSQCSLFHIYYSRELKELEATRRNSRELEGTHVQLEGTGSNSFRF